MKSSPQLPTDRARRSRAGFTLAEVLAALALMAIIIPVALEGMSVIASRASVLGQRKVAAMRVAERVLNEQLVQVTPGQQIPPSANGVETDGDLSYPWTMESKAWPQDAMTQLTVHVTFTVKGSDYDMSASTLYDPNSNTPGTGQAAPPPAAQPAAE